MRPHGLPIGVAQVVDTLSSGGLERLALNLANGLDPRRFRSFLCATRAAGALTSEIQPHVRFMVLKRRWRYDPKGPIALAHYACRNRIDILHAHGSSIFVAAVAKQLGASFRLVWHLHYGAWASMTEIPASFRWASKQSDVVLAVSHELKAWFEEAFARAPESVLYFPNFVERSNFTRVGPDVPGENGFRIVSVGNIRPEKDQITLVKAARMVVSQEPRAHFLIVGESRNEDYVRELRSLITDQNLEANISLLGRRSDVRAILRECSIGVLSSVVEGLPMALLEYGAEGIATVATRVGHTPEVLLKGDAGILVPPSDPDRLASAILSLLRSPSMRATIATRLREHVTRNFSEDAVLPKVATLYQSLVEPA